MLRGKKNYGLADRWSTVYTSMSRAVRVALRRCFKKVESVVLKKWWMFVLLLFSNFKYSNKLLCLVRLRSTRLYPFRRLKGLLFKSVIEFYILIIGSKLGEGCPLWGASKLCLTTSFSHLLKNEGKCIVIKKTTTTV